MAYVPKPSISLKKRVSQLEKDFNVFMEKHNKKAMLDLRLFKAIENRLTDIEKSLKEKQ